MRCVCLAHVHSQDEANVDAAHLSNISQVSVLSETAGAGKPLLY